MEWPLEVSGLVPILVVAYVLAARQARPSRARVAAFAAAILLIVAAFATRLQPLALHDFLWAHLLQNVVLAEWAPALLVLALPPAFAARVRVPPLLALPLWLAVYFTWHLPWLYDLALRHPHSLLHLEHVSYLVAGCLFWWPVIRGDLPAGATAAYLFGAFAVYATYRSAAPTWGLSALADQQIAGVTMAFEQAIVLFAVFARFFLRFLSEEQRAGALDELRPRSIR